MVENPFRTESVKDPNWQIVWAGSQFKASSTFPGHQVTAIPTNYKEPVELRMPLAEIRSIATGKVKGVNRNILPPSSIVCASDTVVLAPVGRFHGLLSFFKPNRYEPIYFYNSDYLTDMQASKQSRGVLVITSMAVGLPGLESIATASSGVIVVTPEDLRGVALNPAIPGGRQLLADEILDGMSILICELNRGPVSVDAFSYKVAVPSSENEQSDTLSALLLATERLVIGHEVPALCGLRLGFEYIANGSIKLRPFELLQGVQQNKVRAIISGSDRDLFSICATRLTHANKHPGLPSFLSHLTKLPEQLFDPGLY